MGIGVKWISGSLLWIATALSTLRPATSPHLSAIRLSFVRLRTIRTPVETAIKEAGNDLRRVADEVTRIERQFEGAVKVTVVRDPAFKVVLKTLNVRFRSCRSGDTSRHC